MLAAFVMNSCAATQSLARACAVWRPVGWSGAPNPTPRKGCSPVLDHLPDGDSATFYSAPGPGWSEGEITLHCNDGAPTPIPGMTSASRANGRDHQRGDQAIAARRAGSKPAAQPTVGLQRGSSDLADAHVGSAATPMRHSRRAKWSR